MHSSPQTLINVTEIQPKVWDTEILLDQHFRLTTVHKRFPRPPPVTGNKVGVNEAMSRTRQRQKKVTRWWSLTLISLTIRCLGGRNITADFLFDFYQKFHRSLLLLLLLFFFFFVFGRYVTYFSPKNLFSTSRCHYSLVLCPSIFGSS